MTTAFFARLKKSVPGNFTVERFEFDIMVVVADAHPVRSHFVGQFAEEIGGFLPALAALCVFSRQTRHDQEWVPECPVELDGARQVVPEQRIEASMRAAAFQAGVIEQLAQGFGIAPVAAGELDRLVAHLRHRRDGARQVLRALVAHRIKLEREWNLVSAVGLRGEQVRWSRGREGRRRHGAGFEEVPSRDGLGFHGRPKKYQTGISPD
jgi:hypothetical protein